MSFDKEGFLDWLDEKDDYFISSKEVEEEWPEFYEQYQLGTVTVKYDPEVDETLVPKRDYRDCVIHGHPLD
jgi:hypothetical protein